MSLSATLSLSASTLIINQPVTAFVTVSNSGGSVVNINSFTPLVTVTSGAIGTIAACATGVVDLGPGATIGVPASGSLSFMFNVVFFAPSTGPIGAGTGTYSISANIVGSDGEVVQPTAATITINPIAQPTTEQ